MKCQKCGKRVGKGDFCPHCGEKVVRQFKVVENKQPLQVFKIIIMVLLSVSCFVSILFLAFISKMNFDAIGEFMFGSTEMIILNIATVFMPLILAFLIVALGWVGVAALNVVGIIIAGLTMIRATKGKKIYLLVLIGIYVIVTVIAIFVVPTAIGQA